MINYLEIKQKILQNGINVLGWRTNKKYIVIESDDWGSIRTPSKNTLMHLRKKNYPIEDCQFTLNDSLERDKDLIALFEVLSLAKDKNGNNAVITANNIVANPDFNKIRANDYQSYEYELFTKTLKKYPHSSNVYSLYKKGIELGLFIPQFHGREHVNVSSWMQALKDKNPDINYGFDLEMFTFNYKKNIGCKEGFADAFSISNKIEKEYLDSIIVDGLRIFENLWGYKSKTVIAPCYTWHSASEPTFSNKGVKSMQGMFIQHSVNWKSNKREKKYHFLGQKSKNSNIKFLVRNCIFEPSSDLEIDWIDKCLREIEIAFKWNKPAIISSHRFNFIGTINQDLCDKNLKKLSILLKKIILKWPDVEFISSDKLTELICVE